MSLEFKAGMIASLIFLFTVLFWVLLISQRHSATDPVVIAVAIGTSAISIVSILVGMVFGLEAAKRRS